MKKIDSALDTIAKLIHQARYEPGPVKGKLEAAQAILGRLLKKQRRRLANKALLVASSVLVLTALTINAQTPETVPFSNIKQTPETITLKVDKGAALETLAVLSGDEGPASMRFGRTTLGGLLARKGKKAKIPVTLHTDTVVALANDNRALSVEQLREIHGALSHALGVESESPRRAFSPSCEQRIKDNFNKFCIGGGCARQSVDRITPPDCFHLSEEHRREATKL